MKIKQPDYVIFFITILLIGIGISMVYSASSEISYRRYSDETFFFKRQLVGSIIAVFIIIFMSYINANILIKLATPLLVISFMMCIVVFIPGLGMSLQSGAHVNRWVNFRFFMFQPSEFVKIAIVVNLAAILYKKQEKIKNFFTGFAWPLLIVMLFFALILIQPDFSTAVFILVVSIVMFYIAGISVKHLGLLGLVGLPIIAMLVGIAGYRLKRLWAFLSTEADVMGAGYQITESIKGFIRGGLTGMGIGKGQKKMPEPFTDFVFSVYGEEMGFLGAFFILILFVILAYRGVKIAYNSKDKFLTLLAFGFTFLIFFQALLNIMVTLDLLPTTGITLPFLSYGRSSLIVTAFIIGVLLNISRKVNSNEEVPV